MSATPVSEGRGMQLLMKMGWKPGQGIGKNNDGQLEPLTLDVKQDRRGKPLILENCVQIGAIAGLVAIQEMPASNARPEKGTFGGQFSHKHPVSLLTELCQKRRWGPPSFACTESGPIHAKKFHWKVSNVFAIFSFTYRVQVVVNGVEYQPAVPSLNKKNGKTQAAQVCLQSIGVLPRDPKLPVVIG